MRKIFLFIAGFILLAQLLVIPGVANANYTAPTIVTLPVSNITCVSAVFKANLVAKGSYDGFIVSFGYGTVPGTYPKSISIGQVNVTGIQQASVTGLVPGTIYYVRPTFAAMLTKLPPAICYSSAAGIGIGLDRAGSILYTEPDFTFYGSVVSFQTPSCQIGTGTQSSSAGGGITGTIAYSPPVTNAIVQTSSASLSAKEVTPGTPVTVTADITNKSTVNGSKKVTLYVNGQVESTQGVTVNSGSSSKLTFNVTRNEPGDYNVYVDGVPAGSFKVELITGNDAILIFSAALVALAFLIGMVMLWRRQRTS